MKCPGWLGCNIRGGGGIGPRHIGGNMGRIPGGGGGGRGCLNGGMPGGPRDCSMCGGYIMGISGGLTWC